MDSLTYLSPQQNIIDASPSSPLDFLTVPRRTFDAKSYLASNSVNLQIGDRALELHPMSHAPEVTLIKELLSGDEAKHFIQIANHRFERSRVGFSGRMSELSDVRTSSTCFLRRDEDLMVRSVQARVSALVGMPESHIEPLQLLRYRPGQHFLPHHDSFGERNEHGTAGDRLFTCLMYLNGLEPNETGGATVFPKILLKVRPAPGCALLWRNLSENGGTDDDTLHGGEPTECSVKYALTAWVREKPFPF